MRDAVYAERRLPRWNVATWLIGRNAERSERVEDLSQADG
jgi:hypothetical protein